MATIQEAARVTVRGKEVTNREAAEAALRQRDGLRASVEHVPPRTEPECRRLGLTVRRPPGRPPGSGVR